MPTKSPDPGYLPRLDSREAFVDYLEGYTSPAVAELEEHQLGRKLVKTYMLETANHHQAIPDLVDLLPSRIKLKPLDDTLYRIEDKKHDENVVGLLEELEDRHPVVYTTLEANQSKKWAREVIDSSPWIDRLWLSSPILFELWNYVKRTTPASRYVGLGFDHTARYETSSDLEDNREEIEDNSGEMGDESDDDYGQFNECRHARLRITERLSILEKTLPDLQKHYHPLHSLVQLQMPSEGRGRHILHYYGQATNRSDSFADHRATVKLVLKHYRKVTEHAEKKLWYETTEVGSEGLTLCGSPMSLQFHKPLSQETFDRFVDLGLQRRRSRFKIGGYLSHRGPTKVHMAAFDRHLWQPFLLEATSKQLLLVLPQGICGNTVHRLVTNVQRYLDPKVEVWLGSQSYKSAVADSMSTVA